MKINLNNNRHIFKIQEQLKNMDIKYLKILIFGIILRLILMPITLHPDLWGQTFTAYFFAYEGVLDIYDHLLNLTSEHPLLTTYSISDIFIYPPAAYFTLGLMRLLTRPFSDPEFITFVMANMSQLYERSDLYWNIFLYKLPYLFVDIILALTLTKFFTQYKNKLKILMLWMFNPVALYSTYMMGQFDIFPVLFSVLALLFAKRNKPYLAMLMLGIGGSYKMYPLLFVIPLALIFSKNFKLRIKYILAGFAPFVITILPYLSSSAFRQMVLFSPKSQKMLFMGFPVSGAEVLFPFVISLSLLFIYLYYLKNKNINANGIFIAVLLLIYSITHYHPQWFLWVTPLLFIDLIKNKMKYFEVQILLFLCWFAIVMLFDQTLNVGLFNPINESLSYVAPISSLINKYFDVNLLKSIIRSIFAGASVFYVYNFFQTVKLQK